MPWLDLDGGGELPQDLHRIDAPTPFVWVIGRTRTDGPQDYDSVHNVQDGYKMTLLSQWGKPPQAITVKIDPSVDMKTPPVTQVEQMTPDVYFAYAVALLKVNGPHLTDQPILARMKRLGIDPSQRFDPTKVDPIIRQALQTATPAAQKASNHRMAQSGAYCQRLGHEHRFRSLWRELFEARCRGHV